MFLHVIAGRVQQEAQSIGGGQDGPRAHQHTVHEIEEGAVPGGTTWGRVIHPAPSGQGNLVDWERREGGRWVEEGEGGAGRREREVGGGGSGKWE